jgi:hypothetical protein
VLALQHFDLIIGMDWLEEFSPIKIHWAQKWINKLYHDDSITLHGLLPGGLDCAMVELMQLTSVLEAPQSEIVPQEIQNKFQAIFDTPSTLPPRRSCDHVIPLIPGAAPVQARSYRYAPALKMK